MLRCIKPVRKQSISFRRDNPKTQLFPVVQWLLLIHLKPKACSLISNNKSLITHESHKNVDANGDAKGSLWRCLCPQSTVSSAGSDRRQSGGTSFPYIHLFSLHSHRAWEFLLLICAVKATRVRKHMRVGRQWSCITRTSLKDRRQRYETRKCTEINK